MSSVSFVKIKANTKDSIKNAIQESLRLVDYSFPQSIKRVVIKPNLCYYQHYTTGHTTEPKFVAALAELIREEVSYDVEISVVESDASAMKCKYAFRMLGYDQLAKDYKLRLINLSEDESDSETLSVGRYSFALNVPRTIRHADLRINMPKIKYTIAKLQITCALKNIFGCNPYQKKYRYHARIEEAIVAINKAMKFDLCIVDGNIVSGMNPCRLGLVMASQDPVAIDAAAAKIAGVRPSMRFLKIAETEKLGRMSFDSRGMRMRYFQERYPRKSARNIVMSKAYTIVVRVDLGKRLGLQ